MEAVGWRECGAGVRELAKPGTKCICFSNVWLKSCDEDEVLQRKHFRCFINDFWHFVCVNLLRLKQLEQINWNTKKIYSHAFSVQSLSSTWNSMKINVHRWWVEVQPILSTTSPRECSVSPFTSNIIIKHSENTGKKTIRIHFVFLLPTNQHTPHTHSVHTTNLPVLKCVMAARSILVLYVASQPYGLGDAQHIAVAMRPQRVADASNKLILLLWLSLRTPISLGVFAGPMLLVYVECGWCVMHARHTVLSLPLWHMCFGCSFFLLSIQLKCFRRWLSVRQGCEIASLFRIMRCICSSKLNAFATENVQLQTLACM